MNSITVTTESVPAKLMTTATGLVVGVGEIFEGIDIGQPLRAGRRSVTAEQPAGGDAATLLKLFDQLYHQTPSSEFAILDLLKSLTFLGIQAWARSAFRGVAEFW